MIFYRPMGLDETRLVWKSGMKMFPPRLPEQPFFYPVINKSYAHQIASDWNTKVEPYAGYVSEFVVRDDYVDQFSPHIVGSSTHKELWVPSEQMEEFNNNIIGTIQIVRAFYGCSFTGYVPESYSLKSLNALRQFVALNGILNYSFFDFHGEISSNSESVFLNFAYWLGVDFSDYGIDEDRKSKIIFEVRRVWIDANPGIMLPKHQ